MVGMVVEQPELVLMLLHKTDAVAMTLVNEEFRQARSLAEMAAGVVPIALPAVA